MKESMINKMIGQYCKFVINEPGEKKASTITGILKEIDKKNGFLIIESKLGEGIVNINSIIAIKPKIQ